MGGLTAGTCSGIWTWIKWKDKVSMVACTATLMGMVLVNMFFYKTYYSYVLQADSSLQI